MAPIEASEAEKMSNTRGRYQGKYNLFAKEPSIGVRKLW